MTNASSALFNCQAWINAVRTCAEAPEVGVEQAMAKARAILCKPDQDDQTDKLKARIVQLGAEVFESTGAQLDVQANGRSN